MSDTALRDLVLKRLEADTKPEDEWSALVLAALEGPDELAKLLDEEGPEAANALWVERTKALTLDALVERQAIVNSPGTRSTIARASGLVEVPS